MTRTSETVPEIGSIEPNQHGYRTFTLGSFTFSRDEYFAHVAWPKGHHMLPVDAFLRALQRDIAWGFFYGIVNFDKVVGTVNHYGSVDLFAGRFDDHYRRAKLDHTERFQTPLIQRVFEAMLEDWTNAGFDPFASPQETGSAFGPKNGSNKEAITRHRVTAKRMIGAPGDEPAKVRLRGRASDAEVVVGDGEPVKASAWRDGDRLYVRSQGVTRSYRHATDGELTWIGNWPLQEPEQLSRKGGAGAAGGAVTSPILVTVLLLRVAAGEQVSAGQPLLVVEAMKMEHTVVAPIDGAVAELAVHAGQQVRLGQQLAVVAPLQE